MEKWSQLERQDNGGEGPNVGGCVLASERSVGSSQALRSWTGRRRDGCHDEGGRHFAKPLLIGASAHSVLCQHLVLGWCIEVEEGR